MTLAQHKINRLNSMQLIFAALGGFVLLFVLAPIGSMILHSTPAQLSETVADAEVRRSIWLTLWTSMAGTLLFAFAAIPFAYLLARHDFPFKRLVNAIINVPVVIPHSAAGIAILGLVAPNSLLGQAADKVGIQFIGGHAGIMAAMVFVSLPFLINAARDSFAEVPERLEKAASDLGASPLRVFLTISLPLAWRGVLSGLILMWARGLSEFGAIVIVAYRPMVTPILIYERFTAYGLNYARPVAVLFVLVCLVFFVVIRLLPESKNNA